MSVIQGRIPGAPCPHCGRNLTEFTGIDGVLPKPGDLTICSQCGVFLIFQSIDPTHYRPATVTEVRDIAPTRQFRILSRAVMQILMKR